MQVEMIGTLTAAQFAMQEGGRRKVCICFDDRAALIALRNMKVGSKLTLEFHNLDSCLDKYIYY